MPAPRPTCDTAGILAPIIGVIASIEAGEAIKILSGHRQAVQRNLLVVDLWENHIRQVRLDAVREAADCPTCHHRLFPWLDGQRGSHTAVLCGRNAVQLTPPARSAPLVTRFGGKIGGRWPRESE